MTTDTESNINEALDWLQKTGGAIQDFASEQAPIYCKEVVAWELWSSIFFAGIGLAILLGLVCLVKQLLRWDKDDAEVSELRIVLTTVFAIVSAVVGPVLVLANTPQVIKAAVSPRMVIVEHLSNLRK